MKKQVKYGVYLTPGVNGGKPYVDTVPVYTSRSIHRDDDEHLLNVFDTPEEAQKYIKEECHE